MRTPEFEFYHGVVIRQLVVAAGGPLTLESFDFSGRVDSFRVNGRVAVHIKHSTARLPPWPFTVNSDTVKELIELRRRVDHVFLVCVCGDEGIVTLSLEDFMAICEMRPGGAMPIRIHRNRNEMFLISGNRGNLDHRKSSGVERIIDALQVAK